MKGGKILIVDLSSHQIKQYSNPADLREDRFPRRAPVWSPNSQYLTVAASSNIKGEQSQVVLLSLSDNRAYQLGVDVDPAGWMK